MKEISFANVIAAKLAHDEAATDCTPVMRLAKTEAGRHRQAISIKIPNMYGSDGNAILRCYAATHLHAYCALAPPIVQ